VAAAVGTWLARGITAPADRGDEESLLVAAGAVPVVRSGEHPGS
jgi:hypothetical protein